MVALVTSMSTKLLPLTPVTGSLNRIGRGGKRVSDGCAVGAPITIRTEGASHRKVAGDPGGKRGHRRCDSRREEGPRGVTRGRPPSPGIVGTRPFGEAELDLVPQ